MRRWMTVVALALVAFSTANAHAAGVVLGSETRADDEKQTIAAARQVARGFTFADVDAADAAEQLRHADVILAVGARALTMARAVAPETPVVYALVPAAEALPGKMVTGVALEVPPYVTFAQWKQLRFDGQRVGFVYDKSAAVSIHDVTRAASALGLTLVARAVGTQPADDVVAELAPKVDAMWIAAPLSPAAAAKWSAKVALVGSDDKATAAGALFSLAPDPADIGRRAARMAVGIAGRAPAERVPVPPPTTSPGALTLNAATAQALGIELPDAIVKKARKIYR